MEDEKVKQLAETLKNQGLAASTYEAIEKAKRILNVNTEKSTEKEKDPNRFSKSDYEVQKEKASINELMKEVGVTPEQVEEQEKEDLDKIKEADEVKEEIKEVNENPEKVEQIREESSKFNEEVNEIVEERLEDQEESQQTNESKEEKLENPEQEDRFKEEKNIDLTKVFKYNK